MKTFGQQIIDELRRQGEYGEYFDFEDYKRLRELADIEELRTFLKERGYELDPVRSDAIHVVDYLVIEKMKRQRWFGGLFH